jgi:membrane-bound lytic murein transglycosylase D
MNGKIARTFLVGVILIFLSANIFAQQQDALGIDLDDLLSVAHDWAKDNLDESVFDALGEVDQERVRAFLTELENRFQTNSVYELGPLRERAKGYVDFLEQWEETMPLAEWLKTRLDYMVVSEELKKKATPGVKPGGVLPPPEIVVERTIWKKEFERRPIPAKAEAYVPMLKKIFATERTPPELIWVAEVESSFNPNARSPVGAAGLFQLMKPTAKSYGLSTFLPDERTDPEKNARAAAQYLRYLHRRFGDWRLALAAYNAGETRVDNLLKNARRRDYAAIANKLPAETQMYVPKCEAALQRREGVALAELRTPAR